MKKTILLADEDPAVRRMLCRLLAEENYSVLPVHDRQELTDKLRKTSVDLVLFDPNGPIEKGWELAKEFRSGHPGLPVIILTSQPKMLPMPNSSGIAILEKPLDLLKLLATIEDLLQQGAELQRV